MASRLPTAIVGASGYTGAELLRLLCVHPLVEITEVVAGKSAGKKLGEVFPQFRGVPLGSEELTSFDAERIADNAELCFVALPHGESAKVVAALREREVRVIDLSADFRLRDPALYAQWYGAGQDHPAPQLLAKEAIYGLPELYRDEIRGALLVAAPGCYPTSAILPLAPFATSGQLPSSGLVIDSKSGVSGAGRNPGASAHFPEVGEGVRAYKVAGEHRHTPEIEQELSLLGGQDTRVIFTPHLVPMSRGILSCAYVPLPGSSQSEAHKVLADFYSEEAFVDVLETSLPDTAHVRGSNRAQLAARYDERTGMLLLVCAIDNLCKGSSGQAIQCMNLQQGWAEETGLTNIALFP